MDAHCTDTTYGRCPGGDYANGNSDETKCDGAPVYQRVGEGGGVDGGGPVLYRYYYGSSGNTYWRVGSSGTLADCGNSDYYLFSGSNQGPTGGAPTAPGYSAGDGWTDVDTGYPYATGTISVSAGGGGGGGGGH